MEPKQKKIKLSLEKVEDTETNITSLPDDVLTQIFEHLRQDKFGHIARTCKRWDALIKCPLLWKKVDVRFPRSHKSPNEVATLLCRTLPTNMTHMRLDFENIKWICRLNFEPFCKTLAFHCPSLKVLVLRCANLSVSLQSVIDLCDQYLTNLEELSLHICHFSMHFGEADCSHFSKIKVLDLYKSYDDALFSRAHPLSKMPSLRRLRLGDSVNDNSFEGDVSFLHHLQVLHVSGVFISSRTFQTLQTHAPNLTELCLYLTNVKDWDFRFCTSVFPQLKTVCLGGCRYVTCAGVIALILSCPFLQNVYVDAYVAKHYKVHPFALANQFILQIVKIAKVVFCGHPPVVDYFDEKWPF